MPVPAAATGDGASAAADDRAIARMRMASHRVKCQPPSSRIAAAPSTGWPSKTGQMVVFRSPMSTMIPVSMPKWYSGSSGVALTYKACTPMPNRAEMARMRSDADVPTGSLSSTACSSGAASTSAKAEAKSGCADASMIALISSPPVQPIRHWYEPASMARHGGSASSERSIIGTDLFRSRRAAPSFAVKTVVNDVIIFKWFAST